MLMLECNCNNISQGIKMLAFATLAYDDYIYLFNDNYNTFDTGGTCPLLPMHILFNSNCECIFKFKQIDLNLSLPCLSTDSTVVKPISNE